MDQLNRRIDQLDKQVSVILRLLMTAGPRDGSDPAAAAAASRDPSAVVGPQRHDAADKTPAAQTAAAQSPSSFMDTIAELDEDTAGSSLEAAAVTRDAEQRRTTSDDEHQRRQRPPSSKAAQSSSSSFQCSRFAGEPRSASSPLRYSSSPDPQKRTFTDISLCGQRYQSADGDAGRTVIT